MTGATVEVSDLVKTFGGGDEAVRAVNGVSFAVDPGEIFGLLGPNGAGKTTITRILATILTPDEGTATVAGRDVTAAPFEVRSSIAYMPQEPELSPYFTVRENVTTHLRFFGFDEAERRARTERALDTLDLDEHAHKRPQQLSTGLKRRVQLARTLATDQQVVFLDEPTAGLDAAARRGVCDRVADAAERTETTVFLLTHVMRVAERLCDRVAILDDGRLVADGPVDEIVDRYTDDVVTVRPARAVTDSDLTTLRSRGEVEGATLEDGQLRLRTTTDDAVRTAVDVLTDCGIEAEAVQVGGGELEDAYLNVVENEGEVAPDVHV